jgi:UPF0271 protein
VSVRLQPFGDAAWRVRLPEGADPRAVLAAIRAVPGVVDAIVSERDAAVTFDPAAAPIGVDRAIEEALSAQGARPVGDEHFVRVRYGGPDLDEVARRAGISSEEVVSLHSHGAYSVVAIGFLPGFAYLRGLDPRLVVPRRPSPRPRVDALSVGLAGPYTGVYPFASPGGWNLIGVAVGFNPFRASSGATVSLGDRVRFVPEES